MSGRNARVLRKLGLKNKGKPLTITHKVMWVKDEEAKYPKYAPFLIKMI